MSKLPRDVKGEHLVRALERIGYVVVRQTGSHVRLRAGVGGQQSVTIPLHNPIKVGTLSGILDDVATQTEIDREALLRSLDL